MPLLSSREMNQRIVSISGIAHDLNNQVMILFNSLDKIMRDHPGNPDVSLALKAAEQCAGLTAQLLPQKQVTRSGFQSIREIAGETALLVRSLLPSYNRLNVECLTDCQIPNSDAEVQHILMNLCLNAMQAMDGPGVIRLTAERRRDAVIFTVSDTGPGVPAELRDRIFDPLFTTRAERGGHGLGLARVREAVQRRGGDVEVCAVDPHGACFRICLPLAAPSVTLELAHLSD